MPTGEDKDEGFGLTTELSHLGRPSPAPWAPVNHGPFRASTILFRDAASLDEARRGDRRAMRYGLLGNPAVFALEESISHLEGAEDTVLYPSGLAAIAGVLIATLNSGDHLLMADTVYFPTRRVCDTLLARMGIETTYYPAEAAADLSAYATPNTKMVFMESPGTNTFEMIDTASVVAFARERGLITAADNTWASGYYFRPLEHGVDISLMATTKFVAGHSDVLMGSASASGDLVERLRETALTLGYSSGSEEVFLAQRGMRTLQLRLDCSGRNGRQVAEWLRAQPAVAQVLHPAFEDFPGHEIFTRDLTGASGLFSFVLDPALADHVPAFLDRLELFGLGGSWGGYESLVLPQNIEHRQYRPAWLRAGPLIRVYTGLEDASDLITDLKQAFEILRR